MQCKWYTVERHLNNAESWETQCRASWLVMLESAPSQWKLKLLKWRTSSSSEGVTQICTASPPICSTMLSFIAWDIPVLCCWNNPVFLIINSTNCPYGAIGSLSCFRVHDRNTYCHLFCTKIQKRNSLVCMSCMLLHFECWCL